MKKKRAAALLLSVVLAVGCFPALAAEIVLTDMDQTHWAYDAVSKLVENKTVNGYEDGSFRPNGVVTYAEFSKMITGIWKPDTAAIDREMALALLWEHSGSPKGYTVPAIISDQMTNKNAVAWGYSTGLMQGNDGLNLRAKDSLTRAEAATLIVRAEGELTATRVLEDTVDERMLKTMWDSYDLFGIEYNPSATITPAQLIGAVEKLALSHDETFPESTVSVFDAAVMLIYASVKESGKPISAKNIDAIPEKFNRIARMATEYALNNGIVMPKDTAREATHKDIAIILLQTDYLFGRYGIHVNKNLSSYPSNFTDYAFIEEEIPVGAYAMPLDSEAKPADYFDFAHDFALIFDNLASDLSKKYGKDDSVKFTFYPLLYCETAKESVIRMKCQLTGVEAKDVFGEAFANAGKEFFVDIHTGNPVADIIIPVEETSIGQLAYTVR